MSKFILGTKGEMNQFFDNGVRIPVTHILTSPCYLVDIKLSPTGGIWSVLLGTAAAKHIKKPALGQLKKAGIATPLRFLREIKVKQGELVEKEGKKGLKIDEAEIFVGMPVTPTLLFKKDDQVQVTGISKGKGFAGVVKRHGFAGGPRTHGQSDRERAPGSIGASTTPGRVMKGKRMAGRMGGDTVTVKNLKVVDATETELVVKGLVPGAKKSLLIIKS